jgi:hypothetical protein
MSVYFLSCLLEMTPLAGSTQARCHAGRTLVFTILLRAPQRIMQVSQSIPQFLNLTQHSRKLFPEFMNFIPQVTPFIPFPKSATPSLLAILNSPVA